MDSDGVSKLGLGFAGFRSRLGLEGLISGLAILNVAKKSFIKFQYF